MTSPHRFEVVYTSRSGDSNLLWLIFSWGIEDYIKGVTKYRLSFYAFTPVHHLTWRHPFRMTEYNLLKEIPKGKTCWAISVILNEDSGCGRWWPIGPESTFIRFNKDDGSTPGDGMDRIRIHQLCDSKMETLLGLFPAFTKDNNCQLFHKVRIFKSGNETVHEMYIQCFSWIHFFWSLSLCQWNLLRKK